MYKAITTIVALAVSLGAQSQPPAPAPTETSQPPQSKTAKDDRRSNADKDIAEKAPLVGKIPPAQKAEVATSEQAEHRDNESSRVGWMEILTGLMALATGILAYFTFRLAGSTKALVDTARDTAERQLRAYVAVIEAEMTDLEGPVWPGVKVVIHNGGQTPAYKLTHVFTAGPEQREPKKDILTSKVTLAPRGQLLSENRLPTPQGTPEILGAARAALINGAVTIYLTGEINYVDAFKRERFAKYRAMFTGDGNPRNTRFICCDDGNEAD